MSITVRPAGNGDAPGIAMLLGELGYPSTEEQARARLESVTSSGRALVAESEGKVLGCIVAEVFPYFPSGTMLCRIMALVVAAEHRGRGVGARLVERVNEFAVERGCSGIEVTTAERRADAHRFYEGLGFNRTAYRLLRPF